MRSVALLSVALALQSAAGQAAAPTLVLARTIGCESCGDATQFGTIWDVSVSSHGQILVTEKTAPMLRLFDQSGKLAWSGGRSGKGPGEYLLPFRSSLSDSGIVVVDMTNSRITDLTLAGDLVGSIALTGLATTVGTNPRGDLILGMDNRSTFKVARRAARAEALEEANVFPGSLKNKSVALAPNGSMAVALDGESYEIVRVDVSGKVVGKITRSLERPRRSSVEEADYRQRLNRTMELMSAERKTTGGSGGLTRPVIPAAERGLKPHIAVDGLRYDGENRLWVRTMRGDEARTVFDVFSDGGVFVGSVTIPHPVTSYSVSGAWLAAAVENADGVPVVKLWALRK